MARVGGFGICDNCGQAHLGEGVYVAVINRWLCPKCYEHWLMGAVNYPEDAYIERKNLRYYATLLKAEV